MALGDAGVEVSEGDWEEDSAERDGEEDSREPEEAEDDKDGGTLVVVGSEVEVTDPWLVSVPDVEAESISD